MAEKKSGEAKFTWIAFAEGVKTRPLVGLGTSKKDMLETCTKYLVKNPDVKADDIRLRRLTGREERLRVEPKLVF